MRSPAVIPYLLCGACFALMPAVARAVDGDSGGGMPRHDYTVVPLRPYTSEVTLAIGGFIRQQTGFIGQDGRSGDRSWPVTIVAPPGGATPGNGSASHPSFGIFGETRLDILGRIRFEDGSRAGFTVQIQAKGSDAFTDESVPIEVRRQFAFYEHHVWGRVEIGTALNAANQLHVTSPDAFSGGFFNGGYAENWIFNPTGSPLTNSTFGQTALRVFDDQVQKITYFSPRIEGFQVGVSYMPSAQPRPGNPVPIATRDGTNASYVEGFALGGNYTNVLAGNVGVRASLGLLSWGPPSDVAAPRLWAFSAGAAVRYSAFEVGASFAYITAGRDIVTALDAPTSGSRFPNLFRLGGFAVEAGASYTFNGLLASANFFYGSNNDTPVAGAQPGQSGRDSLIGGSLAASYVLGLGVSLEAVAFTAYYRGNENGPNSNNRASGAVGQIALRF